MLIFDQQAQGRTVAGERSLQSSLLQGSLLQNNLLQSSLLPDSLVRTGEELFGQALTEFRRRNLGSAAHFLEQALQHDPDAILFRKLALDIARESGDIHGVSAALAQLIRVDPEERQYYLDQGYVLAYLGAFDEALQVYDQFIGHFGAEAEAVVAKARLLYSMGRHNAAINLLEDRISKDPAPTESMVYISLAEYYNVAGRSEEALRLLARLDHVFPRHPLIELAKADAYRAQGSREQAFIHLKAAFSAERLDADAQAGILYNLLEQEFFTREQIFLVTDEFVQRFSKSARPHAVAGDVRSRFGEYQAAITHYRDALARDQQIPEIWQQLLQLLLYTGDVAESQKLGSEAAERFPTHADILLATGNAYLAGKDDRSARHYLESAYNHADPANSAVLSWILGALGSTYHALGMHRESDVAFTESLAQDSLNVVVLNNYAYYLALRKENLQEAARMSRRTLDLEPGEPTYEDTYAWILFQQGNYKEALTWIQRALQHAPQASPTLLEHFGDILYMNGKRKEALMQWRKARQRADEQYENLELLSRKINEKRLVE